MESSKDKNEKSNLIPNETSISTEINMNIEIRDDLAHSSKESLNELKKTKEVSIKVNDNDGKENDNDDSNDNNNNRRHTIHNMVKSLKNDIKLSENEKEGLLLIFIIKFDKYRLDEIIDS